MYNKVVLVGHLTRDIDIRYAQTGSAFANTGIATNKKWKAPNGEMKTDTMFIDITFFGRTAEIANQYLRKGSKVLVDGRLVFQQWTAQDGSKRSKHTVTVENLTMLDTKAESQALSGGATQQQYQQPQSQPQQQGGYNNNMNSSMVGYNGANSGYNAPQQQGMPMQQQQQQSYGQPQQPPVSQQQQQPYGQKQQTVQQPSPTVPEIDINEDEIPF